MQRIVGPIGGVRCSAVLGRVVVPVPVTLSYGISSKRQGQIHFYWMLTWIIGKVLGMIIIIVMFIHDGFAISGNASQFYIFRIGIFVRLELTEEKVVESRATVPDGQKRLL